MQSVVETCLRRAKARDAPFLVAIDNVGSFTASNAYQLGMSALAGSLHQQVGFDLGLRVR